MARALLEAGHHPDLLYGTSAGALNAAWLAADPTREGVASLARLWSEARRRDIFPLRPWTVIAGLAGALDHTVNARGLARWLRSASLLRRLEDGVLPLTVVATDVETGEEVLLDCGPAVPALLASSAMPGVFPPVRVGERWLVDGSVSSDTPLGAAVRGGADRVWVLPSVPSGAVLRPRSALDLLLRSTAVLLARQNADAVEAWCGRCELYLLPAPIVPGTSPFRFDHSRELVEAGYRLATAWLEQPRVTLASSSEASRGEGNLQSREMGL